MGCDGSSRQCAIRAMDGVYSVVWATADERPGSKQASSPPLRCGDEGCCVSTEPAHDGAGQAQPALHGFGIAWCNECIKGTVRCQPCYCAGHALQVLALLGVHTYHSPQAQAVERAYSVGMHLCTLLCKKHAGRHAQQQG